MTDLNVMMRAIQTRYELALILNIPLQKLTHILYVVRPENCYTQFEIPKKSGGVRSISAPNEELEEIQRKLVRVLSSYRKDIWDLEGISPNIAHAFEKGKSIITNAQIHRNKRYVLNFDLEDFFGSIHFGRVVGYFEKNNRFEYSHEVAVAIAQLTCYRGSLPQGAPTSPILANMICEILDYKLLRLAKKYRLDYTRYADDMTFSTNDKHIVERYDEFCVSLGKIVEKSGFSINAKKTRMQFRDSRQTVTGLVVNKKISVDHRFYKQTRAMAHTLYKEGKFRIDGQEGTLEQLEGRFTFIDQLDVLNNEYRTLPTNANPKIYGEKRRHCARNEELLNGREKEFRQFLFYKYFFAGKRPVIITEGPTDILYLKAAMASLYEQYPKLVCKKDDGSFEFLVEFFDRSTRMDDLFDISKGGADSLLNIYDFYTGRGKRPAYFDYFVKTTHRKPDYPVIIVLDNEPNCKDKPLHKMTHAAGIKKTLAQELSSNYKSRMVEGGNLYLVTHQPTEEGKDSEIENLFDEKTVGTIIDGKKLTLRENYDLKQFYGKDIFSKYVYDHYEEINFDGFKILLDRINECVLEMQEKGK